MTVQHIYEYERVMFRLLLLIYCRMCLFICDTAPSCSESGPTDLPPTLRSVIHGRRVTSLST